MLSFKKFKSIIIKEAIDKSILTEATLSGIVKHLQNGDPMAIISAFRGEYSFSENIKRTKEMRRKIMDAGFGITKMIGGYTEVLADGTRNDVDEEHSSFIWVEGGNLTDEKYLRDLVEKLGREYEQDSVLFIDGKGNAYWIFTRKDNFMGKPIGSIYNIGKFHPKKIGDYFSKVGKKQFSFVPE